MKYQSGEIKKILGIDTHPRNPIESQIAFVEIDSRSIAFPNETLFVTIKGQRKDGISFIPELIKRSCFNFLIDQKHAHLAKQFPNANFYITKDVVGSLQKLARHHRKQYKYPLIGITGSNGKTTIKEWLYSLLSSKKNIIRSPRSFNSQIGVPLSILKMKAHANLAIIEAGISKQGEMTRLEPMILPDVGIFSSIGDAHNEGFDNRKQKLDEKWKLFETAQEIFYHELEIPEDYKVRFPNKTYISCGNSKQAAFEYEIQDNKRLILKKIGESYELPFYDKASIRNLALCIAYLKHQNISAEEIQERILRLSPVTMRMEMREGRNGCIVINDSYNFDIQGLSYGIDFLQQQNPSLSKTIILSDIYQRSEQAEAYRKIANLINQSGITKSIFIGKEIHYVANYLDPRIENYFFNNTNEFLEDPLIYSFENENILLKAARDFQFEKIFSALSLKVHDTVLEINLNQLASNIQYFKKQLSPDTRIMAMVKASAYGTGDWEIASFLESQKIDYLAVAYTDEGIQLRQKGISLPIVVLHPDVSSFEALVKHKLEAEIYSLEMLKKLVHFLDQYYSQLNIHINLDTGMHRLGFMEEDLAELAAIIHEDRLIKVKSIFSHLAASDNPAHDAYTRLQIERFDERYDQLMKGLSHKTLKHLLNSNGVLRWKAYEYDMVRLGIGIYGIGIDAEAHPELKPVHRLSSRISQIKKIKAGESVGYDRKSILAKDRTIAIINIGYADGIPRAIGNGKFSVAVLNQPAEIVGNVCMDTLMIDVSHINDVMVGDEVVIFDEKHHIKHLAESANTIAYEIISGISKRVKRVFHRE